MELRENYGLLKKTLKLFVHGLAQAVLKFLFFYFLWARTTGAATAHETLWLGYASPRTPALGSQMPHPAVFCCGLHYR